MGRDNPWSPELDSSLVNLDSTEVERLFLMKAAHQHREYPRGIACLEARDQVGEVVQPVISWMDGTRRPSLTQADGFMV
jgi:hypothetical protein